MGVNVYFRKLFPHDISHQISVTSSIVREFFQGDPETYVSFHVKGMKTGTEADVTVLPATDCRFSASLDSVITAEKGGARPAVGDILVFCREDREYLLDVVLPSDARWNFMNGEFFPNGRDRHKVACTDNPDENISSCTFSSDEPRNRIIFGAPGTGKSYRLNEEKNELLEGYPETNFERVTFHPDYTYGNFVGSYKPSVIKAKGQDGSSREICSILIDGSRTADEKCQKFLTEAGGSMTYESLSEDAFRLLSELYSAKHGDGSGTADDSLKKTADSIRPYVNLLNRKSMEDTITYEYVPGPFMRVLVEALNHPAEPYLLIIEEINRANMAAVFGDVFQLLDRAKSGESEYAIQASEEMREYLKEKTGRDFSSIKIPGNMFIWATMNSADQGVFPMDTAFRRRWEFEYLGIDENEDRIRKGYSLFGHDDDVSRDGRIRWNAIRKGINSYLAGIKVNEDKQLGPFFISSDLLVNPDGNPDEETEKRISARFSCVFKSKVIMYLFEDAAKLKKRELFNSSIQEPLTFSKICSEFDRKGIGIFNPDIISRIRSFNAD